MEQCKSIFSSKILNSKPSLLKPELIKSIQSEEQWRHMDTIKSQDNYIKTHYENFNFNDIVSNPLDSKKNGLFREDLFQSNQIQSKINEINKEKTKFIEVFNGSSSNEYFLVFIDSQDRECLIIPFSIMIENSIEIISFETFMSYEIKTDTNIRFVNSYSSTNFTNKKGLLITDLYSVYHLKPSCLRENILFTKIAWLESNPINFLSKTFLNSFFTINNQSLTTFLNFQVTGNYDLKYSPIGGTYFNHEEQLLLYNKDSLYLFDLRNNPITSRLLMKHNYIIDEIGVINDYIYCLYTTKSFIYFDIRFPNTPINEDFLYFALGSCHN